VKPVEKRPSREGRNDRNGRNRNNRNKNRNKQEAGERNTQPARAEGEAKADNKEPRQPNNRNQRNRQNNKPEAATEVKAEQPKDVLTHGEVAGAPDQAEGGDERRRGRNRRGRNRGRDRAERNENSSTTEASAEHAAVAHLSTASQAVASTEADAVAPTFTAHETPAPSFTESRPTPAPAIAAKPEPVQSEADVVVMPAIEVTAPATSAPAVPSAPAELPKVEFKALEATSLTPVLESAGLVWVNTDSQKLAEVRAQIAAEPVTTHAPRQPKPPAEVSTGPMVLVETGGKEQTIEK
jgi:ribonuclease E